jgi:hypothetical protein
MLELRFVVGWLLSGRFQFVEALGLFRCESDMADQIRHAGDCIERHANLVRHVGKEGTHSDIGGFGFFLGKLQTLGCVLLPILFEDHLSWDATATGLKSTGRENATHVFRELGVSTNHYTRMRNVKIDACEAL